MIVVLLLYFVVLFIIAIHSATNVKSVPDFFVARKGASVQAITGSLVATILGGSAVIGAVDAGPKMGGATAWFMLVGSLGLFLLLPFVKKAYAHGKYTLPDLIENLFGKFPRTIASIIIPLAWTGIIAAQIIASAKLLQSVTPLNYEQSAVISAFVFIFYTIAGGQLSILRTDLLQAILILVGLVVIVVCAVHYGFSFENVPAFPFNANFTPFSLFLLILTYGSTFTAGPDMYSRLFCAKDSRTAQKSVLFAAVLLIPVAACIGFLGAFGIGIENVQGARISAIASLVVPTPLVPVIALALLSIVLSSADTTLLSSSIIVCELLFQKCKNPQKNAKENFSLLSTRIVIFVNGIVAFVIALLFTDIIRMLLMALAIYAGAFIIPVLFGLAGMRIKPKFVSAAIIAGGLLAFVGKFLENLAPHFSDVILVIAFVVNALLLIAGRIKANY